MFLFIFLLYTSVRVCSIYIKAAFFTIVDIAVIAALCHELDYLQCTLLWLLSIPLKHGVKTCGSCNTVVPKLQTMVDPH